jgi:thiamine biosynthesis protein ThiS
VITVNGKKVEVENLQLSELLTQMDLANQLCAVEVNKILVPHKERDACKLQDGDIVEIVTLVGGG